MYYVIKCVKTKRVLKGNFASSVFHRCNAKTQKTEICVTGPQCVKHCRLYIQFGFLFFIPSLLYSFFRRDVSIKAIIIQVFMISRTFLPFAGSSCALLYCVYLVSCTQKTILNSTQFSRYITTLFEHCTVVLRTE
jgi:hypothetical protein